MTRLTFLGTGTSQGVPVIGCECEVCRSQDPKDNRLRTSALIRHGKDTILIDAGPDFRQQMLRERIERLDGILMTHEHKDHLAGLDDIRAFNYTMGIPIDIYATEQVQQVIMKDYDYAFAHNKYPGAPDIRLRTIDGKSPFVVGSTNVIPVEGMHYKLPVLGFRIGGIAYLTDFNHIEAAELEKIRGVEILVINALRHEPHLSHFNLEEALEVREQVSPQYTYITHVSHQMGLAAGINPVLPANTYLAWDGKTVESSE